MVVLSLVRLRERVMVGNPIAVIFETSEVGLRSLLLFNFDCHNFSLVVSKSDLDFKLVGHDEFVGFK